MTVLSMAVQVGFIVGTLLFSGLALADRVSPVRLFFSCAVGAAMLNAMVPSQVQSFGLVAALRGGTGFFLAGVYPVGMRIAASWSKTGLGSALGWLVGALVLGTAAPHAARALGVAGEWRSAFGGLSLFAALGAASILVAGDGPHLAARSGAGALPWRLLWTDRRLSASLLGYFGHMWELYAFWVHVPVLTRTPALTALVIAIGAPACVLGGRLSLRWGSAPVAALGLGLSAACCLAAPILAGQAGPLRTAWLLLWGAAVVLDSPQLSALTAQAAPRSHVGSFLTFSTALGFLVTLVPIEFLGRTIAGGTEPGMAFLWLAPGPLLGFLALVWGYRPGIAAFKA